MSAIGERQRFDWTPAGPGQERLGALRELFPEAFHEGKVDFDALRAALGDGVDERPERYLFSWAGKRDALRLLQTPSAATLAPAAEESVDFENSGHVFIEGDNLETLKLLYKAYFNRVKMIYIDPPYNTGNDFIYPDNFADPLASYLALTGQKDAEGNLLSSNPETGGRYHSAWLSMMYPRLFLARQLLRDDGVIFVSIDDHEVHNLRLLMNDVFGEENFIATVIWQKVFSPKNSARHFSEDHDYIVVYARNAESWLPNALPRTEDADARYTNPDNDPRGPWSSGDLTARNYYSEGSYEVVSPAGKTFRPARGRYWSTAYNTFVELDRDGRVWWGETGSNMPRVKRFISEVRAGIVPQTLWKYDAVGHTQEAKQELLDYVAFGETENVLNTVKPTRLLRRMLAIGTDSSSQDIVMDFFSGSGATAHAVLNQNFDDGGNRRFIVVQFAEQLPKREEHLATIADIGKERIRRVIAKLKEEQAGTLDLDGRETPEDLGFRVFKLAESNARPWQDVGGDEPGDYAEQLTFYADPLRPGWQAADLLWEVILKEGLSLSARVEQVEAVTTNTVYRVTDDEREQTIHVCLDDVVCLETGRALGLGQGDRFICRDVALDDSLAANLALQCQLITI